MLPLTCYVGVVGLIWERQAFQAWWRNETAKAAGTPVLERRSHLIAYARWWSRATVLRWMISASHLWWIIKVPRWALFQ